MIKDKAVTPERTTKHSAGELPAWDCDWAATKAADALRGLGRNFPEALEGEPLRALYAHEEAANAAARRGDKDAYLEALRELCRAGREEALRVREAAA
jgi:hypothetical protein